jgi:hypothetical protein
MPVNLTITIGKNVYSQTFPGEPKDKISIQVQTSDHLDYFNSNEGNPGSLSDLKNSFSPEEKKPLCRHIVPVEDRTDPDGKVYPTLTAMCEAWNIPVYIYKGRRNLNWSKEDALLAPIGPQNKRKNK